MPHHERRGNAAVGDAHPTPLPQVVAAFPEMQIAVAHPGGKGAQEHLAALRHRRLALPPLQWSAEFGDVITDHGSPHAVAAPSTGSAAPETNEASSEIRKRAALAISSGLPVRPIGFWRPRCWTSASLSWPAVRCWSGLATKTRS